MPEYELTLISKAEDDKEAVKELIAKVGGDVTDERPIGQKPLAYPIKKEKAAYFTLLRFRAEPETLMVLNKELLLSAHVLRHMVTTARAKAPVAAAILAKRAKATKEAPVKVADVVEETIEKAETPADEKPAKKTKTQIKQEAQVAKEREKKIAAELEKILSEE